MLPVLKSKIAEKIRILLNAELGDDVDNLVQSLVESFAPPWLGQNSKFIAILGNNIAPASELASDTSEEYFFQIRILVRSPFNPRQKKNRDLDDLTTGLYALDKKIRSRIAGAAGIDIINEANTILDGMEADGLHSLIRWRQTVAEPILLPSSYFGSDPVIDNPHLEAAVKDIKLIAPVTSMFEGLAIDSYYGGVKSYPR